MKSISFILLVFVCFVFHSCSKLKISEPIPLCIDFKIRDEKPLRVEKWKDNENVYYFIISDCCDQLNYLFLDCNKVCAPSGGWSGVGVGPCPTFVGSLIKTQIWEKEY